MYEQERIVNIIYFFANWRNKIEERSHLCYKQSRSQILPKEKEIAQSALISGFSGEPYINGALHSKEEYAKVQFKEILERLCGIFWGIFTAKHKQFI